MTTKNQPEKLDHILLEEDQLLPSSGFAASVMDAIHHESLVPAPIPFPWLRALPGILALIGGLVALGRYTVLVLRNLDWSPTTNTDWLAWYQSNAQTAVLLRTAAAPALLALAASFACLGLCRLAIGRRTIH